MWQNNFNPELGCREHLRSESCSSAYTTESTVQGDTEQEYIAKADSALEESHFRYMFPNAMTDFYQAAVMGESDDIAHEQRLIYAGNSIRPCKYEPKLSTARTPCSCLKHEELDIMARAEPHQAHEAEWQTDLAWVEVGKLFVGGLPLSYTNEQLLKCFRFNYEERPRPYTKPKCIVRDLEVVFDRNNNISRGFGFIRYVDPSTAMDVLQEYTCFRKALETMMEVYVKPFNEANKNSTPNPRDPVEQAYQHLFSYDSHPLCHFNLELKNESHKPIDKDYFEYLCNRYFLYDVVNRIYKLIQLKPVKPRNGADSESTTLAKSSSWESVYDMAEIVLTQIDRDCSWCPSCIVDGRAKLKSAIEQSNRILVRFFNDPILERAPQHNRRDEITKEAIYVIFQVYGLIQAIHVHDGPGQNIVAVIDFVHVESTQLVAFLKDFQNRRIMPSYLMGATILPKLSLNSGINNTSMANNHVVLSNSCLIPLLTDGKSGTDYTLNWNRVHELQRSLTNGAHTTKSSAD